MFLQAHQLRLSASILPKRIPKYEELLAVYVKQCVPSIFKHIVVIHFQLLLWSQTLFLC